ncbi:hypothetical protein KDL01_09240 [Actinospica durhamensis]|uniref:Uncharacterized protein n=1 Tax=Actinospica durhamensis TaxID=1508375 RepID=A0A941ETA0_9ACTN|nr:hypothetical protein [Actinospica durhamensis]MBR7833449.1 hypothetical protein [Actinospica durhamensis]
MSASRDGRSVAPFGKVDTSHYPDLVEGGGLVEVLRSVAAASGFAVGEIGVQYPAEFAGYTSAAIRSDRGQIDVGISAASRLFDVTAMRGHDILALGETSELPEVLAVAAAWKAGAPYEEFADRFPFMEITEQARIQASPDPVAAQWDYLLADDQVPEELDLLKALHENAAVRIRYPELSHRTVWLSRERLKRAGRVHVWVAGPGRYCVQVAEQAETRVTLESLPATIAAVVNLLG